MSLGAWAPDVTDQLLAQDQILPFAPSAGRGLPADQNLGTWTKHPLIPNRGRGWLELSSEDALLIWAIETSRNGVSRVEYRRTGPASRDGVFLESGVSRILYWVVRVVPFHVNQINGARGGFPLLPVAPRASARFWPGNDANDFLRTGETYGVMLDGNERPNTGGITIGFPVGYTRWASCTFGRSITWRVQTSDLDPTLPGTADAYSISATYASFAVSPWLYVSAAIGGGPTRTGQVVWSVTPPGVNHG